MIMRNLLRFIVLLLALSFSSNVSAAPKDINAADLVKLKKENNDLVIIDSRYGDSFTDVMIKGATHLDAAGTNMENLTKLAPSKNQPLVFYCVNEQCPASIKASIKASKLGYKNVYEYRGGIEDWKERNLPVTRIKDNN